MVELKEHFLHGHRGEVTSLLYIDELAQGLLISGSHDGTIKVWDPWLRDLSRESVQTLNDHSGTICDIAYGGGTLVSCSSDRTFR